MSVILDALSKARTDRRKTQGEPHPNSVARVLEPVANPPEQTRMPHKTGSRWVVPVVLMLGILCLMTLAGGAFFLLYDQMRRLDPAATSEPASASLAQAAVALPEVPVAALATPLPLSELPVHTPAPVVAAPETAAPVVSAAAPAPSASPANAGFKLGSIVCEANDCIANLNGRSVRLGDTVRNYQVIEITPSAITLQGASAADVITLSHYD